MNAAAVHTGKPLCFQFDCLPAFFFDCFAGIGQLRRRRKAQEQALEIRASLRFRPSRRIEYAYVRPGRQLMGEPIAARVVLDVPVDPAFKERLRRKLWDLVQAQVRNRRGDA